ncbi:MAG: 3-oxoacyl-ACP reductase family protein [Candidatus Shapirobacteria bacterium]
MFDLTGKKALVTGGSRGIGRGIALALAKQGADVAVNYRSNQVAAEAVVGEIKALGRQSLAIQADVAQKASVVAMFEQIKSQWGKLDILVNNAGIVFSLPVEQTTEQQWDQTLATNLKGQFLCVQEVLKMMGQGGRIINLSSIASGGVGAGFGNSSAYVASKGGVIGLVEDLAVELAPKGININAIAPGIIATDMTKEFLGDEQVKAGFLAKIPKKRLGKPEDIGAAAVYLASDEADYVTGTVLYVDGGWLTG